MRNAKAIVLWGRSRTGKTTTLNMLIQKIQHPQITPIVETDDKCVVLNYKGKTILIITAGDAGDIIQERLESVHEPFDFLVCASRCKGGSVKYLRQVCSQILWVKSCSVTAEHNSIPILKDLQFAADRSQADLLLSFIEVL